MRYTAEETYSAANRIRRQTELRQTAGWSDCQLTADALRLQMNHVCTKKEFWYRGKELRSWWTEKLLTKMFSTGARVSAKTRDENV